MNGESKQKSSPWYLSPWILFAAGLAAFGIAVYHQALAPGHLILTTDDNIGALAMRKRAMPYSFFGSWDDSALVGYPVLTLFNWTNLLLWLLPLNFFNNWIHAIDLVAASYCFARFLRLRGLGNAAAALGAFASVWVGSTFFLTYAGHIGKFGVVVFASAYLWMIERAIQTRRVPYGLLAGGALGGMFLEQADVALFFAMPLGLYAVYGSLREHGRNIGALVRIVAPVLVVSACIAIHPVYSFSKLFSSDDSAVPEEQKSPEETWNYCTQWSWPPDEAIEFIVPGYMGWRSGEPEGPYWGVMGQSAEWEQTKQGFRNFKLETMYLGAVPMAMAVLAILLLMVRRKDLPVPASDAIFWLAVLVVTYVLALGKFFPLYRAFFALPGMSSIRNPVKFLQVTQFAFAILGAFGVEALVRRAGDWAGSGDARKAVVRFAIALLVLGGLFGAWSASSSSSPEAVARFQREGWGPAAPAIVSTIASGLGHACVVTMIAGALLLAVARVRFLASPRMAGRMAWCLLAFAALDQLSVSGHYVRTVEGKGFIDENDVVKFMKTQLGSQRPYMMVQSDFYNLWLTYLFPYHGIPAFNVTQMRMTGDYEQFLKALSSGPTHMMTMWRETAIGYIMGPGPYLGQLQQDSNFKGKMDVAFAFNAFGEPGGGVLAVAGTSTRPGEHGVLKMRETAPRYQLLSAWETNSLERSLAIMAADGFKPFTKALLANADVSSLPPSSGEGPVGTVEVQSYRSGKVVLRTTSDQPAILRVADKFEKAWKAAEDDNAVPVFRCDYLFMGVPVHAGIHTVTLTYAPPLKTFWSQLAGMAICAGALAGLVIRKR